MLMHSFLVTGYLYRHIADHLELQAGLDRALPAGVLQDDLEQDLKPGQRFGWRADSWDGYAKVRVGPMVRPCSPACMHETWTQPHTAWGDEEKQTPSFD